MAAAASKSLGAMIKGKFSRDFFGSPVLFANALANEIRLMADRIEALGRDFDNDGSISVQVDAHVQTIIEAVSAHWRVEMWKLRGKSREQRICGARQVAMYLCRKLTLLSYPQIGELFERDHSTVLHATRVIEERIEAEPQFAKSIQVLADRLGDFGALKMAERMLTEATTEV